MIPNTFGCALATRVVRPDTTGLMEFFRMRRCAGERSHEKVLPPLLPTMRLPAAAPFRGALFSCQRNLLLDYVVSLHNYVGALRSYPALHLLRIMISKALVAASLKPFILSILAEGESYGYEIIQRVHDLTGGELKWTTGTLYPLLHSLENEGMLTAFWREAESGPDRKYYQLTPKGYKALSLEKQQWMSVHRALQKLWGASSGLSPA